MPTVAELKKEAKSRGLKGYSKLLKAELEKLLGRKGSAKKVSAKKVSAKKVSAKKVSAKKVSAK